MDPRKRKVKIPRALSKMEGHQEQAPSKAVWRSMLTFRWMGWEKSRLETGCGLCCLQGARKPQTDTHTQHAHLRGSRQPVQAKRQALERSLRSGLVALRVSAPHCGPEPHSQTPAESVQTAGAPPTPRSWRDASLEAGGGGEPPPKKRSRVAATRAPHSPLTALGPGGAGPDLGAG